MTIKKPSPIAAKQGMTLMELMVVIAIIMILMGTVVGISGAASRNAAESKTRAELADLSLALESFRADNGAFPVNLTALVNWYQDVRHPGVLWDLTDLTGQRPNQIPVDAWGRAFDYDLRPGGLVFTLRSRGPDGNLNTPDDISLRD